MCFIADGDTHGFLQASSARPRAPSWTTTGQVLGSHDGAYGYTVGQRKGLRIDRPAPDGRPRYVLSSSRSRNR